MAASKRQFEESETPTSSAPRKKRIEVFGFKNLCLYCDQAANKAAEAKKNREVQTQD